MLDSTVAMIRSFVVTLAVFFLQASSPAIITPQTGDVLRGQVSITGNTDILSFASAELDFAYASDSASTWFLIQAFSQPVANAQLAVWDTTILTDGNYNLRLRVFLQDGTTQEAIVKNVRIQNDFVPMATETPTPTATPLIISPLMSPLPTSTPVPATATPSYPTPTALPANPALLKESSIFYIFQRGALYTLIVFALIGLFLRLRRSNT